MNGNCAKILILIFLAWLPEFSFLILTYLKMHGSLKNDQVLVAKTKNYINTTTLLLEQLLVTNLYLALKCKVTRLGIY